MNICHVFSCALVMIAGVSAVRARETNVPPATPRPPAPQQLAPEPLAAPAQPAPPARRAAGVEIYVDREGWQSGIGLRGMEHYVQRLANHVQKNIPGLIAGVAGGKRGILLITTFRGRRNFYRAKENTEQFLKAIVNDLATRLPEPVAAQVIVRYNGADIIIAERVQGEVRVKFLE